MIGGLKALARPLLHAATRIVHPLRRARALGRLERAGPLRSVLFLCLGNVCRSPYAAAFFARVAPETGVDSAGFIGPGRSPAEEAQRLASERGIDLSAHVSKVVTAEIVRPHDLVVVMDPRQRTALRRKVGTTPPVIVLGDLDPVRPAKRAIRDPWGQQPEVFRSSFDRIDRCIAQIMPYVARHHGEPGGRRTPT